MQALIVVVIMVFMSVFGYMEMQRNDVTQGNKLIAFKASNVAANIMQYADMLTQFSLANYDSLHDNDYSNGNNVGHVTIVDYQKDGISIYSQKNLMPFLNYSSAVFNYGINSNNDDNNSQIAQLYLVISFDDYLSGLKGYSNINLDHVMGELASKYSTHLYQGSSVTWAIPIIVKQDNTCNAIAIFGQVPIDSNNSKQMNKISTLFNRFCMQLKNNGYSMQKYVYVAPIIPTTI